MRADYEVAVCGGGMAGVCAAVAAARGQARTILLERNAFPGGNATAGLVAPFMGFTHEPRITRDPQGFQRYDYTEYLNGTIFKEIIERVNAEGGMFHLPTPLSADPEVLKYVLETMLVEAGADICYTAQVCGATSVPAENGRRTITGIDLLCKEGPRHITAKQFIDATGDADLTFFAGGEFMQGDEQGATQAATLMFLIDNVDEATVTAFRRNHPEEFEDSDFGTVSGFTTLVAAAAARGELPEHIRRLVLFRSAVPGRYAANITHYFEIDATKSDSLTAATIELRKQMFQVYRVMQRDIPGFSRAYISASGSYPGIRESRRIVGRTCLTVDMLREKPIPERYLALCSSPIDLHMKKAHENNMRTMGLFGIPVETAIHRDFTNLYAAGRNISTDRLVNSSIRIMGVVAGIGEAVGKLAAEESRQG